MYQLLTYTQTNGINTPFATNQGVTLKQTARPSRWGVLLLLFIVACLVSAPMVSADEDEIEVDDDAPALVQDDGEAESEDPEDEDDQVAAASDSDDDDDGKSKGKYIAIGGVGLASIFGVWKWLNRGRRLHKSSQTINRRRERSRRSKSGIGDIFGDDDSGGGDSGGGGD